MLAVEDAQGLTRLLESRKVTAEAMVLPYIQREEAPGTCMGHVQCVISPPEPKTRKRMSDSLQAVRPKKQKVVFPKILRSCRAFIPGEGASKDLDERLPLG